RCAPPVAKADRAVPSECRCQVFESLRALQLLIHFATRRSSQLLGNYIIPSNAFGRPIQAPLTSSMQKFRRFTIHVENSTRYLSALELAISPLRSCGNNGPPPGI